MKLIRRRAMAMVPCVLLILVTACSASPSPRAPSASGPGGEAPPRAQKILTVAINREPPNFMNLIGGGTSSEEGGVTNPRKVPHDELVVEDDRGILQPRLAQTISVEQGTWRINPDGTMDTLWKLRPDVKWHDGTPMTASDFVFAFNVFKDPEIATLPGGRGRPDLLHSATAPDPLTFAVHWTAVYARANEAANLVPLPQHILGPVHSRDKTEFINHPYHTTEFVGVGPYRLERWEQGSHMEFVRFDSYYLGRPPLDRLIFRFMGDPNALVANILAGSVDVVLPTGVSLDAADELKRRWEGTGHQVRVDLTRRLHNLEPQFRPEHSRPRNGLNNPVRQALYHALDRQTLVNVITYGLAPPADSYIRPEHPLRREIEPAIPQYPYDPVRSQQLLAQAGWTRGADGILVHQPSGERFEIEVWGRGTKDEPVLNIVADAWRTLGADPKIVIIPPARASDREYEATHSGPLLNSPTGDNFYDIRLHPKYIAAPENRWTGANRAGYVNPKVEQLMDRLAAEIDVRQHAGLHREMMQEAMADLGLMPLWWEVVPVLAVKGVTGFKVVGADAAWDVFHWNRE